MAPGNGGVSWKQVGTLIGCMAGLATLHGAVIVPAILDAAQARAQKMMDEHLNWTEDVRSKYATRVELEWLRPELTRIETRLAAIEIALRAGPPK